MKYEYNNKIITDVESSYPPREWETVSIWEEKYIINHVSHEVEIKKRTNGKKSVVKKKLFVL